MNNAKLQQLIAVARREVCPPVPGDFVADTLRLTRQVPLGMERLTATVKGQLNALFSPVSLACVSLIIFALMLDWGLTAAGFPQPDNSLSRATAQVFLTGDQM